MRKKKKYLWATVDTMYVKKMSDLGVRVAKIRKHMEQESSYLQRHYS